LPPRPPDVDKEAQAYLPDFCAAGAIFVVVLVAELVAILLTLASHTTPGTFLTELAKMSMFILWLGLLGAAILCKIRPWVEKFGAKLTSIYGEAVIINDTHAAFILRTFAISSIVIALAMRYLYISSEWRRSIVLEAQARISALQALIRPHFLFNSMNTIASLTRTDPRQAEEAVEDLADLLRANLGGPKDRTSLKEELEVAAIYQRIEKLRLGERLTVNWNIGELPMRALIPSLTIQPLLENAIYHGIELLPDGGEVTVNGVRIDDDLEIEIRNPVPLDQSKSKGGNQMALSNIRQRFELAYGEKAAVSVDESDETFSVKLRFPCEENAA
jgi:two-component system sensor histidine kinase AlgZ